VTATDPAPGAREREQVVARWPDLWRQLTRGVNGVHLAGGGLHVGGGGAGVQTSILTARLAVDAMLGRPLPPAVTSPLAAALYRLNTRGTPVSEIEAWFDRARGWRGRLAADVCPLAVRSWSRCGIKPHTAQEDAGGSLVDRCADTRQPDEYLVAVPHLDRTVVAELLRVSDGTQTVRALAVDAGFDVDQLLEWMQALWQHNALTWLPPQEGLTAVVRCRLSDSGPEET
jgi:hypothetical protein